MRPIDILSLTVVLCTVAIVVLMATMPGRIAAPAARPEAPGTATFRYPAEPGESNDEDRALQIRMPDRAATPPADAPRFYYPLSKRTYSL